MLIVAWLLIEYRSYPKKQGTLDPLRFMKESYAVGTSGKAVEQYMLRVSKQQSLHACSREDTCTDYDRSKPHLSCLSRSQTEFHHLKLKRNGQPSKQNHFQCNLPMMETAASGLRASTFRSCRVPAWLTWTHSPWVRVLWVNMDACSTCSTPSPTSS